MTGVCWDGLFTIQGNMKRESRAEEKRQRNRIDVFREVPDEVLPRIFRWLDSDTLLRVVPAVCPRWRREVVHTPDVHLALPESFGFGEGAVSEAVRECAMAFRHVVSLHCRYLGQWEAEVCAVHAKTLRTVEFDHDSAYSGTMTPGFETDHAMARFFRAASPDVKVVVKGQSAWWFDDVRVCEWSKRPQVEWLVVRLPAPRRDCTISRCGDLIMGPMVVELPGIVRPCQVGVLRPPNP